MGLLHGIPTLCSASGVWSGWQPSLAQWRPLLLEKNNSIFRIPEINSGQATKRIWSKRGWSPGGWKWPEKNPGRSPVLGCFGEVLIQDRAEPEACAYKISLKPPGSRFRGVRALQQDPLRNMCANFFLRGWGELSRLLATHIVKHIPSHYLEMTMKFN